ncbi:MAG: hypothetical protein U9N61_06855 [Euryarchaeota archaeon]|nr:hypothetical protein [Euryarchaeota archaeon]
MLKINEQYIVDSGGRKTAVVIGIEEFGGLMELVNKYDTIETYDTEDVTEDIIEAFKDLKKGRVYSARELLNEL